MGLAQTVQKAKSKLLNQEEEAKTPEANEPTERQKSVEGAIT